MAPVHPHLARGMCRLRKTQKLEDERWLWTTAGTNKQTNLFFHILFICFQTPAGSKRYFSSKIEKKYLLDEKQRQIWIACTFIWRGRTHIGVLYTGGTKKRRPKTSYGHKTPAQEKKNCCVDLTLEMGDAGWFLGNEDTYDVGPTCLCRIVRCRW